MSISSAPARARTSPGKPNEAIVDPAQREEKPRWSTQRLGELVQLTRPYSWLDTVLNALLGVAWARSAAPRTTHLMTAVIAFLIWCSLNWISERVQKDPGRTPSSWSVAIAPVALALGWLLVFGNALARLAGGVVFVLLFIYPFKAKKRALGPMGPLIRGAESAAIFLIGVGIGGGSFAASSRMAGALLLLQTSRSLAADIRDAPFDTFELPRVVGITASRWISVGLLLAAAIVMPPLDDVMTTDHLFVYGALLVQGLIQATVRPHSFYEAHIGFVFLSGLIKAMIYTGLMGRPFFIVAYVLFQIPASLTYWRVPRPSNEAFRQRVWGWIRTTTPRESDK